MSQMSPVEHRVRVAGVLLFLGLLIEAATLQWAHPTAFLVFLLASGLLIAAGTLTFLYSLLQTPAPDRPPKTRLENR